MLSIPISSRLSYRLMDKNDAELLYQLDQDPQVMKYITDGVPSTRENINNVFIPRMDAYRDERKGWGLWQVNESNSEQFIGWILVRPMYFFSKNPELDNLELGWRFFRKSWGKGYASEAAEHIKNELAQQLNYRTFSAIADEKNIASTNVMKKIGMKYIKTYRHIDPLFECDVAYYQIKLD